jgi:hypothetical protein
MKIYVTVVEALRKTGKTDRDETQFITTKIGGKTSLGPIYFALLKFQKPRTGGYNKIKDPPNMNFYLYLSEPILCYIYVRWMSLVYEVANPFST